MERYTARQVNRALAQEQLLQRLERGEDFGALCQELELSLSRDYLPTLRHRYREGGASWEAWVDHRQGHASKGTPERQAWLCQRKRADPTLTQAELAGLFQTEFQESISPSQVGNLLRAEGMAFPGGQHDRAAREPAGDTARAGVFFLQAAAWQMGVLDTVTQVILGRRAASQGPDREVCHHRPETITRRLVHLWWLPRFDLERPSHLRWVRPRGLGRLAGAGSTLGYSALEHFLGDLEALRGAVPVGEALAQRYLQVWPVPAPGGLFSLDNRRKVRYAGYPPAAGKISASDRILGATTQLLVHDAAGHGLYRRSGPGDDRMTRTLLPLVQHFVPLVGRERVRSLVADQELRSVVLFRDWEAWGVRCVTIGRTPTAAQETAFAVEGLFGPSLRDPQSGEITPWVAHAHTSRTDRPRGLVFPAEVTLVLDCRAGLPGRLIPVWHNWREPQGPVELPPTVYVGHGEGPERIFRDLCACQNLDAPYGQKKVAVPNPRCERPRQAEQRQQQAQAKRWATAQRKGQDYTQRLAALEQEARQPQEDKDDLMTYLRMAGENAHRFVQEQYFAGPFPEKVDEETMVRVIYHQPGWVQQRNSSLQVQLEGYRDPKVQAAVVQACQRVNQAQVQLPSGHRLHMEVGTKILNW
jgi:transposase